MILTEKPKKLKSKPIPNPNVNPITNPNPPGRHDQGQRYNTCYEAISERYMLPDI